MAEHEHAPTDVVRRGWPCAAYGDDLPQLLGRDMCFFDGGDPASDAACSNQVTCLDRMAEQRKDVYRRMQELSTHDPLFADLADEFPVPETLLGGSESHRT